MTRHDLTDEHWEKLKVFFPEEQTRRGRPARCPRVILNGIVWILVTGAPWRDLPECFGPWTTVYNRFRKWQQEGLWDKIYATFLADLEKTGEISYGQWNVDGTLIRAHRHAAGYHGFDPDEPADNALGRSRGGFSTKLHVVTDENGIALGTTVSPGQRHESKEFENVMLSVPLHPLNTDLTAAEFTYNKRRWPDSTAGDKAYSSEAIRLWLYERDTEPVIPTRKDENERPDFAKEKYRQRNIVERCIGWIKEFRRVATRYEKKANNFLAMTRIAIILRLLRISCA